MARSTRRWILGVLLATSLPFLIQPFHVDDRIYLEVAENILEKPFFPYDYQPVFEGIGAPDAASHSHLPLVSYYLALILLLTGGGSEWVFHLAFLVFPLLAAWSFHDLARRWVRHPGFATVLLLASTGFMVLSHTLMTEVPLLAFWLWSASRFWRIIDGGSRSDWWQFSFALAGASFISLLSAGLPLLFSAILVARRLGWTHSVRNERFPSGLLALVVLLPLALWFVWYLRAYLHFDRFVLVRTMQHMEKRNVFTLLLFGEKLLSLILNLGGAFLFPLCVWYGVARKRALTLGLAALILTPVVSWAFIPGWPWTQAILLGVFFSSGLLLVMAAIRLAWEGFRSGQDRSGVLFWAFWALGITAACVLLYPSGSVRYTLLLTPPVILTWVSALELRVKEEYFLRNVLAVSVGMTLVFSLLVSWADYRFASLYPRACEELAVKYNRSGRTIWFTGEWGFRYYMAREGARLLARNDPSPNPGDVIIKPRIAFPWVTLYDSPENVVLVEQKEAPRTGGPRLMDFDSKAGFYSTSWGILPWSLGSGEAWEWFNVFEVKKKYEGPIPDTELHW